MSRSKFILKVNSIGIMLVMSLVLAGCSAEKLGSVKEPIIPDNFILRQSIVLDNANINAGTVFATHINGKKVGITANHLFGEAGGLSEKIPAIDIPKRVKSVLLTEAFTDEDCGSINKVILTPKADNGGIKISKDVAAYDIEDNTKIQTLEITKDKPKEGDTIWLAAQVIGDAEANQKLHEAKIAQVTDNYILFVYKDSKLELQATSGAPILNSKGEIIAINISGEIQNGELVGAANPYYSFVPIIEEGLK